MGELPGSPVSLVRTDKTTCLKLASSWYLLGLLATIICTALRSLPRRGLQNATVTRGNFASLLPLRILFSR